MTVDSRRRIAGAAFMAAGLLAAYHRIFSYPFVFLDVSAIRENRTIRHLWPIWRVLRPPLERGVTVEGRPILNFSLALNHAIGGQAVWSYHALNLLIHFIAALALWGVVRRTLPRAGVACTALLPFTIALLWALHPLQTESVTYTIQRAESMMGMFYLLTLYCFIRFSGADKAAEAAGPPLPRRAGGRSGWGILSVLVCLLGMGTKEVMVSAPVMVFLYDRCFAAGSFARAWKLRRGYYLALAATWAPLGWFVATTGGNRGGTSGFGIGVSFLSYLWTQFPAVLHYLRLSLWPSPLVFYYAVEWIGPAKAAPAAVAVAALFLGSVCLLFKPAAQAWEKAAGFAGVWFFAILSPTSLIPGMSQTMAEHRMYLALAPVIALLATLAVRGSRRPAGIWAMLAVAVVLAIMTARRNRIYQSEVALWSDTVAKVPTNPHTQNNFGIALAAAGRPGEAILHFRRALALDPSYPEAYDNLGLAFAEMGRWDEALAAYDRALRLKSAYPEARVNRGVVLAGAGRLPEAMAEFRRALAVDPGYAAARNDLAVALARSGRLDEAVAEYGKFLKLEPGNAEAHYNLANALAELGSWPEAAGEYAIALRLKPAYPEASANLGVALAKSGRFADAVAQYERTLSLTPDDPDVHYNLALALVELGRSEEARTHFEIAARLRAGH